jgi:hypothetical protein
MVRVKPTDKFYEVYGKVKKLLPHLPPFHLWLSSFEKLKKYNSD